MNPSSSDTWLTPVSVLPGRVRWEVDGLRRNRSLAARIERSLAANSGIRSVSANAMSGRVLIYHDDALSLAMVRAFVEQAVGSTVDGLFSSAPSPPRLPMREEDIEQMLLGAGRRLALWIGKSIRHEVPLTDTDMLLVVGLIRPHKGRFYSALRGLLVANILNVVRIVPIGLAMNAIAHGYRFRLLGLSLSTSGTVLLMAGVALGTTLVRARLTQRSQITWNSAARDFQHDLRMIVWEKAQRLEVAAFDADRRSNAMTVLSEDINQCERGLDAAYNLIDLGFNTAAFATTVLILAPVVGLSAVAPIAALVALTLALQPRIAAQFAHIGAESAQLSATLSDSLGGVSTVRSFTGEDNERRRLESASDGYRLSSQRAVNGSVTLPVLVETTILAGQICTYLLNSRALASGHTIGAFSIVNRATGNLMFPFTTLGPTIENAEKGLAALNRVRAFLEAGPFETDSGKPLPLSDVRGEVDYRRIRFAYPGKQPVFNALSLKFKAKSWTGIVGLTGSGKSSLVKLLLRFHRPGQGRVTLDGIDIGDIRVSDLRRAISLVSQDVYLFRRSAHDNIAIGRRNVSRVEVEAAAKVAQAADFIERLPRGYDTVLGDGGHSLSGGERQRIALARAILKDAPILVLDEATSSLDSTTELDVLSALRPQFAGRTVIAISHRLSTVRNADRIVVLENGRVLQDGTHAELVECEGRYQSLWLSQLGLGDTAPADDD